MKIQINNIKGNLKFEAEAEDFKKAIQKNKKRLIGVNLEGADLNGVDLTTADMRRANLQNANLENANLTRANLLGADMRGAKIKGTNLKNANIWETEFDKMCIYVKIPGQKYPILVIGRQVHIGCKPFDIDDWDQIGDVLARDYEVLEEEAEEIRIIIGKLKIILGLDQKSKISRVA